MVAKERMKGHEVNIENRKCEMGEEGREGVSLKPGQSFYKLKI